jgi:uncharacterized protein YjbI with pentapeptide repeats
MTETKKKDIWDKMVSLSTLLASVLVPVVLAIVGNAYTNAMKQSENRVKYTELAMNILKEKPSPDTEALRGWAIEVVNQYSGVQMSDRAKVELSRTRLAYSNMEGSDFRASSFNRSIFDLGSFVDASFDNALFRGANFRHAEFGGADLSGANLSGAKIDADTKLPK